MDYSEKLKHPKWQKKRLQMLERSEFSCEMCGATEDTLHVHHIAYTGSNPWDTPEKLLMVLCKNCHEEEETDLKEVIPITITKLKKLGFKSTSFKYLTEIFERDRGWTNYDPVFDILKMVVDDDELWWQMHDLYFDRLKKKREEIDLMKASKNG